MKESEFQRSRIELESCGRDENFPRCDLNEAAAAYIRDALAQRFSELAVFDARLYIRVCRVDEHA